MLSDYYFSNMGPVEVPEVPITDFDDMSEDKQIEVIEGALSGKLPGITVTQKDLQLYQKYLEERKTGNMPRTSYVTVAQEKAMHEQWLKDHPNVAGNTPALQANATYSSSQNMSLAGYNSFSSGYNDAMRYSNPANGYLGYNPYASTPYFSAYNYGYSGYYGSYGYGGYYSAQDQQLVSGYSDPVIKYAVSTINRITDLANTGKLNNPYGDYYQPIKMETVEVSSIGAQSSPFGEMTEDAKQYLHCDADKNLFSQGVNVEAFKLPYPDPDSKDITVQIPVETRLAYSYFGGPMYQQTPLQRAMATLPPYAYSQEYREAVKKALQEQEAIGDLVGEAVFKYAGLGDYGKYKAGIQRAAEERIRQIYKRTFEEDEGLSPADKEFNRQIREALYNEAKRGIAYAQMPIIPIDYDVPREQRIYDMMLRTYNADAEYRKYLDTVSRDASMVEWMDQYNRFHAQAETSKFLKAAHKAYFEDYNKDGYRMAILNNNPNQKYAPLGYTTTFDPLTGRIIQNIAPQDGLVSQYNMRRAAYLNAAATRGGGV